MRKYTLLIICLLSLYLAFQFFSSSAYEIRNEFPSGDTIICFGDSLTFGTGADRGMNYPSQLSRLLKKDVINAGIPGNTTAQGLKRLEQDVLKKNPAIVFITLGGNDLKKGVNREIAFQNLEEIVTRIQDKGAMVVVGGVDIPFYGKGFGDAYIEFAEKTGSVLVPNVYKGIMGRSALMSDPIHPNNEGYTILAQHFYNAVQPYLQSP